MLDRTLLTVALVVALVVGTAPALALATGVDGSDARPGQRGQVATNGTGAAASTETPSGPLAPGEHLAGVVGAQHAAVEGEVAARAFGQRLAATDSNASKARVVAATVTNVSERLERLQERKQALDRARANGSISHGQYRAQLVQLHATERALERLTNRTASVAAEIPGETLRANGINVTAIDRLRSAARNLTGPEVAEIARSIAGPNLGSMGPPAHAGPPGQNRTHGPGPAGPAPGGDGARPGGPEDGPPPVPANGTASAQTNGSASNAPANTPRDSGTGEPPSDPRAADDTRQASGNSSDARRPETPS